MTKFYTKRSTMNLADRVIKIENGIAIARLKLIGTKRTVDVKFDEDILQTEIAELNFSVQEVGEGMYRIKTVVAANTPCGRTSVFLPRLIMRPSGKLQVDHINHDTLDNTRANLRVCTNQQNSMNRGHAPSHSRTGVLGVRKHNSGWFAILKIGTERYIQGPFNRRFKALEARIAMERQHFGEFAPYRE